MKWDRGREDVTHSTMICAYHDGASKQIGKEGNKQTCAARIVRSDAFVKRRKVPVKQNTYEKEHLGVV